MFFFFKKPEIIVDCFTADEGLVQTMPIEYSTKFMPDWWKKLEKQHLSPDRYYPSGTMKQCRGFVDYYSTSITIPLWSDLAIKVQENNQYIWQFSDRYSEAVVHGVEQRGTYLSDKKYGHMKLTSPWALKTKEQINWVWSQPTWNFDAPEQLLIPPAVVNYKHQCATNVNMFFRVDTPREYLIPFGQPMAHLTPMTESKVILKRHVVTESEVRRIHATQSTFTFVNKYGTAIKNRERFAECPYSKEIK